MTVINHSAFCSNLPKLYFSGIASETRHDVNDFVKKIIILLFIACCRCMYKHGMLFEMYVTLFYNYKKNYISFETFSF